MSLNSCGNDKFSKKSLCSALSSDYTATLEFIISDTDRNITGKAAVTKEKCSVLTFTEPESFEGISVTSDETGNPDVFLIEFSGIPAAVPKNVASEISLMFSLLSNQISSHISTLDENCFSQIDDGTNEVSFRKNGMSYKITYDPSSGIPKKLEAGNDTASVSITVSDFQIKDKK